MICKYNFYICGEKLTKKNNSRNNLLYFYVNLNYEHEAKIYAKSHSVSLSKLIENYLNSLTQKSKDKSSVSALVESLTGIIPNDYEERDDYRNYIDKKYS